ncbi:MAG: hypothetical protein ACRDY7_06665 [Acidimicrobiia bacterium]
MRLTSRERWLGGAVVVASALYVWFTLQPDLVLSSTTANGGDTGAHVWWPAFLRDHVFGKFRLSGWAPDWYAGFPVGHFYFPLPALLIVALDVVIPYNIAFKLVTAVGPVAMPGAAYVFARGIGARWPAPPLFALATLPFLFYTGYEIWGGNLYSNLAGEFSFTISVCLALCFLGTLAHALEHRTRLALPAALLAACVLSHIIVAVFAAAAAVVIWLWRGPLRSLRLAAAVGGVGALLSAVWTLPLVARLGYTADMGWTKEPPMGPDHNLLPVDMRWGFVLAVVGVVAGLAFSRKATMMIASLTVILGVAFVLLPEGRLWNARVLPFYYLTVWFLAAQGVAEIARALGRVAAIVAAYDPRPVPPPPPDAELAVLSADGEEPEAAADTGEQSLPAPLPIPARSRLRPESMTRGVMAGVVVVALVSSIWYTYDTRDKIPDWIRWNYTGYEAKGAAWTEFRDLIETMDKLPPGRALWEPSQTINSYGTSLALELLPHFTDGDIDSMEGLYFESAATTPSHFKMVAELAKQPSNPVRNLRYGTLADFDRGVAHLQLFGVRYLMAQSDEVKAKADAHPDLDLVAGPTGAPDVDPVVARWNVYAVADAPLVEPLRYEPVVVTGTAPSDWTKASEECPQTGECAWWEDWFDDAGALDRPLAADGPADWERARPDEALDLPAQALPEVEVTEIESGDDHVRFQVDRPGVPVLVKTSYFPNWSASGADGPWRVTPNLMVVVPTSREVSLHYGRTPVDYAGFGLTLLGFAGLALIARWRPAPLAARRAAEEEGDGGEGGGEEDAPDEPRPAEEPSPVPSYQETR